MSHTLESTSKSHWHTNYWNTTPLTLNIMEQIARRLELDKLNDEVADKLYWICYGLEDWPEDEGFGSSDSYGYTMRAREEFNIPLEEAA